MLKVMFSTGLPQPNNPPNFLARARLAAAFLRARLAFEPSLAMDARLIIGFLLEVVAWGATLAAASSMVETVGSLRAWFAAALLAAADAGGPGPRPARQ